MRQSLMVEVQLQLTMMYHDAPTMVAAAMAPRHSRQFAQHCLHHTFSEEIHTHDSFVIVLFGSYYVGSLCNALWVMSPPLWVTPC
jgi:hypothetical protein